MVNVNLKLKDGQVVARSLLLEVATQVGWMVANNAQDDLAGVAIVFVTILLLFSGGRHYTRWRTQRKLKAGEDPGMTLRLCALFNPYCELSAQEQVRAAAGTDAGAGGDVSKTATLALAGWGGPGATGSLKRGVLFADKADLAESAQNAAHVTAGIYPWTELGIAVSASVAAALNLTPFVEHFAETLLIGLVGYRILSPLSAGVASVLQADTGRDDDEADDDIIEKKLGKGWTHAALDLVSFLLRSALWVVGVWTFLGWLGFEMNTFVSALGIGGISVALATQAVLKDLVGTAILVFEQWFDVDSKITVAGQTGRVVEFGMRSTKIRLVADGQIMHIPNSTLANEVLINNSDIPKRRQQIDLWLAPDVGHEKLAEFLQGIPEDLKKHRGIVDPTANYMDLCPVKGIRLEVVYGYEPGDATALWKASRTFVTLYLTSRMTSHGMRYGYSRALFSIDGKTAGPSAGGDCEKEEIVPISPADGGGKAGRWSKGRKGK